MKYSSLLRFKSVAVTLNSMAPLTKELFIGFVMFANGLLSSLVRFMNVLFDEDVFWLWIVIERLKLVNVIGPKFIGLWEIEISFV